MKKLLLMLLTFCLVISMGMFVAACDKGEDAPVSETIENGGFETGDLSGWTKDGSAFQEFGITNIPTVAEEEVGFAGSYYFNGLEAGLQSFTGTLRSSTFKVSGTGHIAFLLGAGKDTSKCYVSVHLASDGSEIARQANDAFDGIFVTVQMIRYTVDLSQYMGQNVYIVINDGDKEDDYGYVLCDDFVSYIADTQTLQSYVDEHNNKLEDLVPEKVEEDPSRTYILNPGFEEGSLSGWTIMSGKTFDGKNVVPSTNTFWDGYDYLADGNYFLDGYQNGETQKGTIRSSLFTLAGDGWITFLMGGTSSPLSYVAVCNEAGEELIKQTNVNVFKDPEMALSLSRFYIDASDYIGDVLYIKVVDGQPSGPFGSINVDDFRVSMTEEEVQTLEGEQYKKIMSLPSGTANNYIKNYYMNFDYPFELPILRFTKTLGGRAMFQTESFDLLGFVKENVLAVMPGKDGVEYAIDSVTFGKETFTTGFDAFDLSEVGVYNVTYSASLGEDKVTESFLLNICKEGTILNGGFESGNLDGWSIVSGENSFDANSSVQSTVYDTQDEGRAPYNSVGTYHFDGREAQRGYSEALGFALQSNVFTLSGSGFISFKLGGRTAAVYVFTKDGTQIARYTNTQFKDLGHPKVEEGARLSTMTTYVADLSDYLGQELYIQLVDEPGANWGQSWFDDIIVYYENAPIIEESFDTVMIYRALQEGGSGKWHLSDTPEEYKLAWMEAINDMSASE